MARTTPEWWYVPEGQCSMCGRVPVPVIASDAAEGDDVTGVCLDCAVEVRDLLDGPSRHGPSKLEPWAEFTCPVEDDDDG